MDKLARENAHPRDAHISFDEGPHIYTIDGDSDYMSVTTWNHKHFPEFDADAIILKMMASRNWPTSKYHGMTADEIKESWDKNRDEAAAAGTKMHYDIECSYNGAEIYNESTEWKYFQDFLRDHAHLKPYRTEWMIWDSELRFAGSIDMVFQNDDGTLSIYDWKRCKEIKKDNRWQKATTECVAHLDDCNFNHYQLQLNTYKALLEKNYDVRIRDMFLVCMHPSNPNKSYIKLQVGDLSKEIAALFDLRREMLDQPDKKRVKI